MTTQTQECEWCGLTFARKTYTDYACPDCVAKSNHRTLADSWKRFCPPAFLETDPSNLPKPEKLDEVLKWGSDSYSGLLLMGPTGSGKTRCAWQLVKREYMAGKLISVMDATAAIRFASACERSAGSAARWLLDRSCSELLFIDDVFKCSINDAFEAALFEIINARCNHNLPMIVTTNHDAISMASKFSEDRAQPIIRRLKESCRCIIFA